jgi:predicted Zn finger-like uncharacterized protein
MIVQCKKCGTKFRFDEALIGEEGGWVRCSRCSHVFFLDVPAIEEAPIRPDTFSDPVKTDIFEKITNDEKDVEPFIGDVEETLGGFEKESDPLEELEEIETEEGAGVKRFAAPKRSKTKKWIYFVILLLLLLLQGGVYLWFFPEIGTQVANLTSSAVSNLMEKIQGVTPQPVGDGPAQVQLSDIRQRFVSNSLVGNIRVIEGTAINQSSHSLTRIKIRGEIVGGADVFLGEMEAYCGNLLTGDELSTMTEEQILRELSNPQGSDISNDRIVPKGQIPFMVVFTHEPPGVVKTFVVPAGAERLLP